MSRRVMASVSVIAMLAAVTACSSPPAGQAQQPPIVIVVQDGGGSQQPASTDSGEPSAPGQGVLRDLLARGFLSDNFVRELPENVPDILHGHQGPDKLEGRGWWMETEFDLNTRTGFIDGTTWIESTEFLFGFHGAMAITFYDENGSPVAKTPPKRWGVNPDVEWRKEWQYQILSLDPAKTAEQIARTIRSYAVIHYYDPQNIFSGMTTEDWILLGARVIKIFMG